MRHHPPRRFARAFAFADAARAYWLGIWPVLNREVRLWHVRAADIPDNLLRTLAVDALVDKRGNLEGAAAFATLATRAWRRESIYAMAAFEALFDYVDCLAEQPHPDPIANGRQLHQALICAVQPQVAHADYYVLHPNREDGGYLAMLVDRCREAIKRLPSYELTSEAMTRAASRIAAYQSLNHGDATGSHQAFAEWARAETTRHAQTHGEQLHWWEIAAACGSSLGIFALIAAATRSQLSSSEVTAIERAYFPWIGASNSLLDSLVDQDEDDEPGQNALLDYYTSPSEMSQRFDLISHEAARRADKLPPPYGHSLILAAMIGFYLSHPQAHDPRFQPVRDCVVDSANGFAIPALTVMRSRRAAASIRHHAAHLLGRSSQP